MAVSLNEDDFQAIARIQHDATAWYVWSGGNDANSGKAPHAAKATVAGAYTVASAADVIVVGPGTFPCNLEITSGKPIKLKGAGVGQTTLQAADATFEATLWIKDFCEIEHMTISGSDDGLSGPLHWEPSALPHQVVSLHRVRLYHRGASTTLESFQEGSAIYVYGLSSTDTTALILDDCEIDADGYGIFCEDIHTIILRNNTRVWATVCVAPGGAEASLIASDCEFNYFQRGTMTSGNTAKGVTTTGKNTLINACSFNGYPNTTGANVAIETPDSGTSKVVVTNSIISHSANATSKSFIVGSGSEVYVDRATRYDPDRVTATGTFKYADELTPATSKPTLTATHLTNINTIKKVVQAPS
jgi:hypothetical protein